MTALNFRSTLRGRIARWALLLPATTLLFSACSDRMPLQVDPPGALAVIIVTPNTNAIAAGGVQQFTATGQDANGNVVAITGTPNWSIAAGGGTINASGMFTAGSTAGSFANTVQASSGGISGFASVSVTSGTLATITVTPVPVSVLTGATVQFVATGRDANGNLVAITPSWSVVNGGGTINSGSGLFAAGAIAGAFSQSVKATSGSVSGTASVTVIATAGALTTITLTPNPASMVTNTAQQFVASGQDANGVVVPIVSPLVWSVDNGGGVINNFGVFTAGAVPGNFGNTIHATSGGVSGFASVAITSPAPGPLTTITIFPNPTAVLTNGSLQFTATGQDANGNSVAFTPTWSIVNGGGTIDSKTGLFIAGGTAGTYSQTVKVTSGAVSSTSSVTVVASAGALATIVVNPVAASVAANGTQSFTATGKDANGLVVAISPAVTWSVVNGGGSINASTGLFTAGSATGTFNGTIRATSGSISGTASVTVAAAVGTLASISITPAPVSLVANTTQQFTATGRDANGSAIAITPTATWSVVNGGGSINSSSGLFTAGAVAGTFAQTIKVTNGSVSGFATVTVVAAATALSSITLTPNPASMATGGTQQFTASGRDANGVSMVIVPAVTWSVVNGGGTIGGSSGVFTAGASTGTFTNTVRATSGTVSGFATVTVTSSSTGSVGPSLGSASAFAVLGSTAVSCTGVSNIAGDIGVAPAGAVTGFPAPCTISAPGRATPHVNDAVAMTAQADVTPAFNALAAMPCGTTLSGQDLGGMTLAPGVYCFTSSAQLTGNLTLAGPANGLWVFQVATAFTTGTSAQVIMSGGGQAKNVFWQVGSSATIGQTTVFQGNIVAGVSITLVQGASLVGRALSKAGITMDTNIIRLP